MRGVGEGLGSALLEQDPEGEEELEPAFQVESPEAIGRRAM